MDNLGRKEANCLKEIVFFKVIIAMIILLYDEFVLIDDDTSSLMRMIDDYAHLLIIMMIIRRWFCYSRNWTQWKVSSAVPAGFTLGIFIFSCRKHRRHLKYDAVRSQHPPTQWNLRGGRWNSVEYHTWKENILPLNIYFFSSKAQTTFKIWCGPWTTRSWPMCSKNSNPLAQTCPYAGIG